MKNTGVAWIGSIPNEWGITKIKQLFRERIEQNKDKDAVLLSLFASIGVRPRSEMEEKGNKAQTVIGYSIVKKGDIVVNKLLAWMGAIGLSEYDGVTSPDYDVYTPLNDDISVYFYHYLFRSVKFKDECKRNSRGIMDMRLRTYPHEFKNIIVPLPNKDEQKTISLFLGKESTLIDSITSDLETQIELLKQYKQSLITETVTKGLDKNVMMKDSGVDWIGNIPEHWVCCKQKYLIKLLNGRAYSDFEFEENGKYRVLRVGNLFTNNQWYYSNLELERNKYCNDGDLLYSWSLSYAPIIWHGEKTIFHYHIWNTELNPLIDKNYAYYYLLCLTGALKAEVHETTMGFITMNIMNNSYITLPTLDEQRSIVTYLDKHCSQIDVIIADKQTQLETLKKHKQSLIYEYVTGKKRVAEAA